MANNLRVTDIQSPGLSDQSSPDGESDALRFGAAIPTLNVSYGSKRSLQTNSDNNLDEGSDSKKNLGLDDMNNGVEAKLSSKESFLHTNATNLRDAQLDHIENSSSPRSHPLYQNVLTDSDGLYHCPWEKETSCYHKPEKLRCYYDKFVDSHIKPYRCKAKACENARFSSTACLLRHEREAHAMHGHGEKPFCCPVENCERGPGNGFPRHWNLLDHMRRVHNRLPGAKHSKGSSSKRKLEQYQDKREQIKKIVCIESADSIANAEPGSENGVGRGGGSWQLTDESNRLIKECLEPLVEGRRSWPPKAELIRLMEEFFKSVVKDQQQQEVEREDDIDVNDNIGQNPE